MNLAEQIKEKIGTLQASLLAGNNSMPVLLQEIHKQLKADPEIVTLLTEEEVSVIVSGLMRHTQVEIITAAAKGTGKKALSKLTVDDL